MIRINLLPVRQIKRRQQILWQAIAFLASLILLLAGMGVTSVSLSHQADQLRDQITTLNAQKISFQAISEKIKKFKEDKAALEQKLTVINDLRSGSQLQVRVLDAIATLTPSDRLWLISLQQSTNRLQLDGIALDNATIAQYMKDLDASPYFSATTLGGASLTQIAGKKLKSFTLTISVHAPETENPETPTTGTKK